MKTFNIGDRVHTNDGYDETDHPMWGTVVTELSSWGTLTIRVADECFNEYGEGWTNEDEFGPGRFWNVHPRELDLVAHADPVREMSYHVLRLLRAA